ncbi:hypothetical protein [Catellatospora vulcania]|uniref:hypothetical protein n=1 Tax=Catellatospora vulcania TaxID=1460450 RepID=UPI0012D48E4B|nr:hypothetical protein [Catellatospora vulcania]
MGSGWPFTARSAAYVGGWAAVTAASAAVVWVGLGPVLATAVPEPVPLRLEALGPQLPAPLVTPSRPVPTVTLAPVPSSSPSAPATLASPAPPRSSPSPAAKPAPPSPAMTVDGWQVFTESDGSQSYLRSFPTAGGTAVIRMAHEKVYLVSATPRGDYQVATSQPDPERVVVQFHRASGQIIVDAIWWEGRPYSEVSTVG